MIKGQCISYIALHKFFKMQMGVCAKKKLYNDGGGNVSRSRHLCGLHLRVFGLFPVQKLDFEARFIIRITGDYPFPNHIMGFCTSQSL